MSKLQFFDKCMPGDPSYDMLFGGNSSGMYPDEKHFVIYPNENLVAFVEFKNTGCGYSMHRTDTWKIRELRQSDEGLLFNSTYFYIKLEESNDLFIYKRNWHWKQSSSRIIVDFIRYESPKTRLTIDENILNAAKGNHIIKKHEDSNNIYPNNLIIKLVNECPREKVKDLISKWAKDNNINMVHVSAGTFKPVIMTGVSMLLENRVCLTATEINRINKPNTVIMLQLGDKAENYDLMDSVYEIGKFRVCYDTNNMKFVKLDNLLFALVLEDDSYRFEVMGEEFRCVECDEIETF